MAGMDAPIAAQAPDAQGSPDDVTGFPPCPLFVRIAGRNAVVVGGGRVAERKVRMLLSYGAEVTVIAPEAADGIRELAQHGRIEWLARPYRAGDATGALLVFCASSSPEANRAAAEEAEASGALVNVADRSHESTVTVPACVRRDPLQIAVSTDGASPLVAHDVKREIEGHYGPHWGMYVTLVGQVRELVMQRVPGPASARKPLFEAIERSGLEKLASKGDVPCAEEVYQRVVAPLVAKGQDTA